MGMNCKVFDDNNVFYAPLPVRYHKGIKVKRFICRPEDKVTISNLFKNYGYLNAPYFTFSKANGYIFLYPMIEPDFFVLDDCVEIVYQLSVDAYSLEYAVIPLDKSINEGLIERCTYNDKEGYYQIEVVDMICFILADAVFSKNSFDDTTKEYINQHLNELDNDITLKKLESIFFKFTPVLIHLLKNNLYDHIMHEYYKFSDY